MSIMTFRFSNYSKILKIVALIVILMVVVSMITNIADFENSGTDTRQQKTAAIDKIITDKWQKAVHIWCVLPEGDSIYTADTTYSRIAVTIRQKDRVFDNIHIKNIEKRPENTLLISIQPPLQDALYGIEKREFTIQLRDGDRASEIAKAAVLGTAIQRLDLRAYTTTNTLRYILNALFVVLGLSLAFAATIPVLKKYGFKKYHIKKYQQLETENETDLDPFTFESIEDSDQVVVVEKNVMLLRSWKRLYKLRNEKRIEALEVFFKGDEKNNLLKPKTKTAGSINRMWFGMLGVYVGWLLYVMLTGFGTGGYHSTLAAVFDTGTRQVSSAIYSDLLLAAMLGLGISAAFLITDKIYGKRRFAVMEVLYTLVFGMGVFMVFMLLQSVLNVYLIHGNILGNFLAWLGIGTGFVTIAEKHASLKKKLIVSGITALTGFISYQLCSFAIASAALSTEMILVISLLIVGGLSGGLTYTGTVASPDEPLQNGNADTAVVDEVATDEAVTDETPTVAAEQ